MSFLRKSQFGMKNVRRLSVARTSSATPKSPPGDGRDGDERSWLAAIVESSSDAIIGLRLDCVMESWNQGAERLYGYSAAEAIGQPISMLIPPHRAGEEGRILEQVRRGEPVSHYETERLVKDGKLVDISLTVSPIRNLLGNLI